MFNLIQLFVKSFNTKETSHSVGLVFHSLHCYFVTRLLTLRSLLQQVQKLIMRYGGYTGPVVSLLALHCDFKNVVPTWEIWETSYFYRDDPFSLGFMKFFLEMNPGESPTQCRLLMSLIKDCPRFWR
jgi:hypothetical protein